MKKNRILTIMITITIAMTGIKQPVLAMNTDMPPTDISVTYAQIAQLSVGLSVSSTGKASCSADVVGLSSNSALKVYMYLERNQNGTWTPFKSWSATKTGTSLSLIKSLTVPKGSYRVKASVYANGENVVAYSRVDGY